nr:guanine nucleotide exchange factor DBS isoform X3 [Drosophila bipectinata]
MNYVDNLRKIESDLNGTDVKSFGESQIKFCRAILDDSSVLESSDTPIQDTFIVSSLNSPSHYVSINLKPNLENALAINANDQLPTEAFKNLTAIITPTSAMSGDGVLNISDVADLLHSQYVIITGGRSIDGCPLIVFPDNNNFNLLEEEDYQKLILYITSVPSLQDADLGFHLIVDRRKDRWTSVKTVLQRISMYFPGIIHKVYILRPIGLFQKALSEVSSKFSKDEYRFHLVICSALSDLHEYVNVNQLTPDMGGDLIYSHNEWIQQRTSLEKFSFLTHQVSAQLDIFIKTIHDTEFPNSVNATEILIESQGNDYSRMKEEILIAAKHGESLLDNIKMVEEFKEFSERTGNVSAIQRLLVQLEETERRFDEFWLTHHSRLQQCLNLRLFEQDFRELQTIFDGHLKTIASLTEVGENTERISILIKETKEFREATRINIERAGNILSVGQELIGSRRLYPWEVVQPKCDELKRVCDLIESQLSKRIDILSKNMELMERVEKANEWCANGVELLASQRIEKCSDSTDLDKLQDFITSASEFKLSSPSEFKKIILESTTPETKALVYQVLQRIDDVSLMCDKRIASLKQLTLKPQRPVQQVTPKPAVPLQPQGGAPSFVRRKSHKVNYVHQCKEAIMHKSRNCLLAPRRLDEYRRPPYELKSLKEINLTRRPVVSRLLKEKYENPPTVQSWELLLQTVKKNSSIQKISPHEHTFTSNCSCNVADYGADSSEARSSFTDFKKSRNGERQQSIFCTNTGIKSRADRIARIESFSCLKTQLQSRIPIPISHCKSHQVIHNREHTPKWMFQNSKSVGDAQYNSSYAPHWQLPRYQQKPKLDRIRIRKKRKSLLIINSLVDEEEWPNKQYQNLKYGSHTRCKNLSDFVYECETDKNADLKDSSASRFFSPKNCTINEQKNTKQDNLINIHFMRDKDKFESLNISSQMKSHADPNDLQNFYKEDLRKVTTNELIKAVTQKTKECNIDIEKKLNDIKVREEETYSSSSWINESLLDDNDQLLKNIDTFTSISKHTYEDSNDLNCVNYSKPTSPDQLSEASLCTSSSNISNYDNISICGSESSCWQCTKKYYAQFGDLSSKNPINENCNAVEGVFWNNSYNEFPTEISSTTCCSMSSCDDDNYSCCNITMGDTIKSIPIQQSKAAKSGEIHQNETRKYINSKKSKVNENSKTTPRSTEGEDIVAILPNLNHAEMQIKNKQDYEARCLKRGHVLTELLETEKIYVNEISSILTGYCDQLKSEEFMHLAPVSLFGKEDILFGNLNELYSFHNEVFLKDLENCISTTELVALCFVQRRDTFYRLYSYYCQNIPKSERLRETLVDTHLFFQGCQKRLGHKLPLAAYLLKPVQRITKYQLLLKDLLRYSDSGSCTKELQKALDCMLIVLKCVNDSMHQIAITGFPTNLAEQGELLMQDSFQVWTESKKDIRIRIKPRQRHIFLYQKSLLFCKQLTKPGHNKSTYQFKHHIKMSEVGLTESVRGDTKRFEVWLQGRQEVHVLQAPSIDVKMKWVSEIKRVLLNQLEELKGEKIKQYNFSHRGLMQTTSWDTSSFGPINHIGLDECLELPNRKSNCSVDNEKVGNTCKNGKDNLEKGGWSSDYSNSDDEYSFDEGNSLKND